MDHGSLAHWLRRPKSQKLKSINIQYKITFRGKLYHDTPMLKSKGSVKYISVAIYLFPNEIKLRNVILVIKDWSRLCNLKGNNQNIILT